MPLIAIQRRTSQPWGFAATTAKALNTSERVLDCVVRLKSASRLSLILLYFLCVMTHHDALANTTPFL
jgi:hypothetical protein